MKAVTTLPTWRRERGGGREGGEGARISPMIKKFVRGKARHSIAPPQNPLHLASIVPQPLIRNDAAPFVKQARRGALNSQRATNVFGHRPRFDLRAGLAAYLAGITS